MALICCIGRTKTKEKAPGKLAMPSAKELENPVPQEQPRYSSEPITTTLPQFTRLEKSPVMTSETVHASESDYMNLKNKTQESKLHSSQQSVPAPPPLRTSDSSSEYVRRESRGRSDSTDGNQPAVSQRCTVQSTPSFHEDVPPPLPHTVTPDYMNVKKQPIAYTDMASPSSLPPIPQSDVDERAETSSLDGVGLCSLDSMPSQDAPLPPGSTYIQSQNWSNSQGFAQTRATVDQLSPSDDRAETSSLDGFCSLDSLPSHDAPPPPRAMGLNASGFSNRVPLPPQLNGNKPAHDYLNQQRMVPQPRPRPRLGTVEEIQESWYQDMSGNRKMSME